MKTFSLGFEGAESNWALRFDKRATLVPQGMGLGDRASPTAGAEDGSSVVHSGLSWPPLKKMQEPQNSNPGENAVHVRNV